MKNTKFIAMLLTLTLLSGCAANNAPAETAAPADTTASEAVTEAPPAETEAPETTEAETAAESAPAETTAPENGDPRGETVEYHGFDGTDGLAFYINEGKPGKYAHYFDYAYGYTASGENDTDPAHFDIENYEYLGDDSFTRPELYEIKAGDKFGNMTVNFACTSIVGIDTAYDPYLSQMYVRLTGSHEFTGLMTFFYEEDYAITAGDIDFVPYNGMAGLPLIAPNAPTSYFNANYPVHGEFVKPISAGNLFSGNFALMERTEDDIVPEPIAFSDNVKQKLDEMFGNETSICQKMVKITVSDLLISWNDNFGMNMCAMVITDIEEI